MKNAAKKGVTFVASAAVVLMLVAGAVFALNIPGFGKSEKVKGVNGTVSIRLAKVSDGKAHFSSYSVSGKEIGFFVVKAADGSIRTAFDACDVCYREKKGYEQRGDSMLCKNCNKKFAIARIGQGSSGGCNPSSLNSRLVNGNVVISVNDIKGGTRLF